MGVGPFGAMAAGFAANGFGARFTLLAGAVVCLLASAAFALRLSSIRPVARQLIRDQQAINELPASGIVEPASVPR
jgi:hypothetical protein